MTVPPTHRSALVVTPIATSPLNVITARYGSSSRRTPTGPEHRQVQNRWMRKLGTAPARKAAPPDTGAEVSRTPNSRMNVSWLHAAETTVPAANLVNNRATRDWVSCRSTAPSSQSRIGVRRRCRDSRCLVLTGII
ncbi:MAG: hypothetical protein JO272_00970 [Pseudonocardiales bacterium]|nr:hypothetical protein [Pseudonocardiales bacterium]